jgi:hypothetical protein
MRVHCFSPRSTEGRSAANEVDDGIWLVTFVDYDLGYTDLEQSTLQTIIEIDGGDKGLQVDEWWGEPPVERVYGANTFNILAYWCGTPGRPVNAIPPKAVANCQLREGQRP